LTLTSSTHQDKQEYSVLWLHFVLILVIYAATGYYSPGFDDEYFNLMVVERFGTAVASYTQTTDVHPPLSYIINAWLYKALGGWEFVRMISGILTASSLIITISNLSKGKSTLYALIFIYLLAFNPAILMWGTSLRWYGYFFPVLIWLLVIPRNTQWHWIKFFVAMLWLAYVGYISFFIFPSLFIYYWMSDKRDNKKKIRALLIPGILALLLYVPQLITFLNIHYPRSGGQIFSFSSGLVGIYSTSLSNQGVFPLSYPGLAAAAGMLILFVHVLKDIHQEWKNPLWGSWVLGQIILLGSRIAGKMRNLSVLIPLQSLAIADRFNKGSSRWLWLSLVLIGFGNMAGTYNVIMHEDTTKNSWNLPVNQVIKQVENEVGNNRSNTLIYCHDPIITWHFERLGFPVRSPYAGRDINVASRSFKHVAVIWTNPGYIPKQRMELYRFEISLLKKSSQSDYILGTDKYASFKRKKEPQYPDELIRLSMIRDPQHISTSSVWSPVFINRFK
jgi:hypothetical protein